MNNAQIRTLADNARWAGQLATSQPAETRAVFAVIHADLKNKLQAENQKRQQR